MMSRKHVTQTPRETCYFCGSEGPIETHHIVPERYGGSSTESNLVDLCRNCHQRLENLYTDRTFAEIRLFDAESTTSIEIAGLSQQQLEIILARAAMIIDDVTDGEGATRSELLEALENFGFSEDDAEHALRKTAARASLQAVGSDDSSDEARFVPGYTEWDEFQPLEEQLGRWFSNETLKTRFEYCVNCERVYLPIGFEPDSPQKTCINCGVSDDLGESVEVSPGGDASLPKQVRNVIEALDRRHEGGVPVEVVIEKVTEEADIQRDYVEEAIDTLKSKGMAYQPTQGELRVT